MAAKEKVPQLATEKCSEAIQEEDVPSNHLPDDTPREGGMAGLVGAEEEVPGDQCYGEDGESGEDGGRESGESVGRDSIDGGEESREEEEEEEGKESGEEDERESGEDGDDGSGDDFSESEDDDLRQLVETLQNFVRDSSKPLTISPPSYTLSLTPPPHPLTHLHLRDASLQPCPSHDQ